jgi:hypothetical protein
MTTHQSPSSPPPADRPLVPPPGISGKRLTVWVLVALGLIAISLSYTLWSYNRLEIARYASHAAWREVTEHLSSRYRVAERNVAKAVDGRQLPMEIGEKFRLAIDAFRTTSLPDQQFAAAERVEGLLAEESLADVHAALPQLSNESLAAIDAFNQHRSLEQQLLNSWGGRILDIFLKFESPSQFSVQPGHSAN